MADSEILLEKLSVGGAVRVTAVCAATGVEVVFIAPTHATDRAIDELAIAKLARAKRAADDFGSALAVEGASARRGVVV